MEPYLAQVMLFAGNFAPRGWAFCNGQLLQISSNSALFSLLGTTYGGNGRTTFGLPDLRGRVPVHSGNNSNGPGLPAVALGSKAGAASTTLGVANLPAHSHTMSHSLTMNASGESGDQDDPTGNALAAAEIYTNKASTDTMKANLITGTITAANTGNGQSFTNYPPYLGLNYVIALTGLFPSRA